MKPTTRVVIVEDDPVLRDHLVDIVEHSTGLELHGAAGTLDAGYGLVNDGCDLLLVDLALPDGSGLSLIRHARARAGFGLRIMVISVFGDVRNVVQAIEAGADGYLLKGGGMSETERAIKDVLAGGAPISPAVAGHILARVRSSAATAAAMATGPLTEKETEVLTDLARGFSYKEVAQRQRISHHTVADHVKAIYRKLSVNSRSQAVFEAMQNGLIDLQG
ncbi:MAG: response regulator transcription factor [Micropepsaceae bacterium]